MTSTHCTQSAYQQAYGREPDFTNYAQLFDDEPFIETIDYIFVSNQGVDVVACKPLPNRSEAKGPFPTREEPSDHILIAAELRV